MTTMTNPLISMANLSLKPLNPPPSSQQKWFVINPCGPTESPPQHIEDLGPRLAELLMFWKKSRRITGALKDLAKSAQCQMVSGGSAHLKMERVLDAEMKGCCRLPSQPKSFKIKTTRTRIIRQSAT